MSEPAGPDGLFPSWELLRQTLLQQPRGKWLALLRADQHARWGHGQRIPAESYVDHLASLLLDDETVIDLIYSEVLLRCEGGPAPSVEEYVVRFPRFAFSLRQQFELLHAVQGGQEGTAASSRDSRRPLDTLKTQAESGGAAGDMTLDRGPGRLAEEGWPSAPPGYAILRLLGHGGMGVVYLARHQRLDRLVALKMIRSEVLANAAARKRFQREAALAAQLNHPNIVQVFDVGEHEGRPFLSLEYCPGGSLAGGQPLAPRAAAELVETLARAVEFAHQRGVLHRDLKPGNILLSFPPDARSAETAVQSSGSVSGPRATDEGQVPKIADFGLAKRLESDESLSWDQSIVGTPGYMAPEQASGQEAGAAADVHGLGAILYELLTGKPPYRGEGLLETLEAMRFLEPRPPSVLRPTVHQDLDTICLKCLQKEPGARYASAAELAEELRRFLNNEPIRARPIGRIERFRRWCRRHPAWAALWMVSAAALLLLSAGGLWYHVRVGDANARAAAAQRAERTHHYHTLLQQVREGARVRPAEWTVSAEEALRKACVLDTEARDPVELRSVAALVFAGTDLHGGETVAGRMCAGAIAFHPNGKRLAIGQFKAAAWAVASVQLVDLEDPGRTRTMPVLADAFWTMSRGVQDGVRSVGFSGDGRWLFAGTRSGWVCRWDLDNPQSQPHCWRDDAHSIEGLAISHDGQSAFTFPRSGAAIRRWDFCDKPHQTAEYRAVQIMHDAALCSTGKVLACCREGGIALLNPDDLTPHAPELRIDASRVAFSPDGRMLAAEANGRLVAVSMETGKIARQLRDPDSPPLHEGVLESMKFSPDGTLLATCCSDEEDRKVKLWDVAGGRLLSELTVPGRGPLCPAFSPDGRGLALSCGQKVHLFALAGRDLCCVRAIQPFPVLAMAFSGDGSRLACVSEPVAEPGGPQNGEISLWHTAQNRLEMRLPFAARHNQNPQPVAAFLADSTRLAWCSSPAEVHLISLARKEEQAHQVAQLRTIAAGRDGRLWTAAGSEVCSWSVPQWRQQGKWSNFTTEGLPQIYALAVGHTWGVAGGRNGGFHVLRAADAARVASDAGPGGAISAAALAPDESFAVLGTQFGKLAVVRVPGGELQEELPSHDDAIEALALDGTGRLLATGSRARDVRLWQREGQTFKLLLVLRGLSGPVRGLWLHPDGSRLAVLIAREAGVRVWDLEWLREQCQQMNIGW